MKSIYSLHSKKKRNVKGLKKTTHKEYDEYGKLRSNKYVEFIVIGKNREWKDFMPMKDFKRLNPKVSI